jgi:4-amino-4-deoxy-L-arabinose transferase-like glycosyltransferase
MVHAAGRSTDWNPGFPPLPVGLIILLLGLLLTVPSWFTRDLWNPDEPRYAEVAREMIVSGDWLVPHLNGDIYAEKPPLFFWLSALLQVLGFGVGAGRIVGAGFAIATLFLTWGVARLWWPARTALLSVFVLATTVQFGIIGKEGVLDIPLTFFIMLAVYGFCRHRRDGGRWIALFYAGMGFSVLIKGPVGILIAALAAVTFTLITDGPRGLRARHPLWGIPLIAAIVGLWLVPAMIHGGEEYARIILFRQNVGRMVTSWSHRQPWFYYFTNLPLHFFPWIVFTPFAIVAALWRNRKPAGRPDLWLVAWFLAGFAIFSLISGKRARYLLPLYPPLAILVAVWIDRALQPAATGWMKRWTRRLFVVDHIVFIALGFLFLAVLLAGPFVSSSYRADEPQVMAMIDGMLAWPANVGLALFGIALVGSGIWGGGTALRGRLDRACGLAVAAMLILSLGIDLVLAPHFNEVKSAKEVSLRANEILPPDGPGTVGLYPNGYSGAFNLYTGRVRMPVLVTPEEVNDFLSVPDPRLIITTEKYFNRDAADITAPHRVMEGNRVGHRKILFLGNDAVVPPDDNS